MHTSKNIFKPYIIENIPDSNASNLNSYANSSELNVNSANALQRIRQKSNNNNLISRTSSMPFSTAAAAATTADSITNNSSNQQQKMRAFNQQMFLNYSNKNINN